MTHKPVKALTDLAGLFGLRSAQETTLVIQKCFEA